MNIDLNCDMGESFGAYTLGMDREILPFISSANIACGFHAGDPRVMNQTVRLASARKVAVGAHPGFPDLMGFGRRNMDCTPEEIQDYLIYQIGALQGFCRANGIRLRHVKPHGALYNLAVGNESLIRAISQAVARVDQDLLLVTLAGIHAEKTAAIAREEGIRTIFEAFPDRAYTARGTLVPRRQPGAVIHDPEEAADRALRMVSEGVVIAADGTRVPIQLHTLCVHGDNPAAVMLAKTIRNRLESSGIHIRPAGEGVGS